MCVTTFVYVLVKIFTGFSDSGGGRAEGRGLSVIVTCIIGCTSFQVGKD